MFHKFSVEQLFNSVFTQNYIYVVTLTVKCYSFIAIVTDWGMIYAEVTARALLCSRRRCKIVLRLLRRQRNKRKKRRTTNPCESKRLWGVYLAAPCGYDNGHLGSKRTTIHLNPGLPGKTHNPPNTHDPPLDRQQEKNGTLKARDKTKQYPFLPVCLRLSMII